MDQKEALKLLSQHFDTFVQRPYANLVSIIGSQETTKVVGPSGTEYQLEFEVFYDSKPGGDIRIVGCIDDGGIRAFVPLTSSEIMTPTGELL